MTNIHRLPDPKGRLSAKLRKAIELHYFHGLTVLKSCEEAGMSTAGYYKAVKRQVVQDFVAKIRLDLVDTIERRSAAARVMAIDVAVDLMQNAKSETVRARMAEFLASEGKTPQVAVHVDARTSAPQGYEFVRPGQQIVDIVEDVEAAKKADAPAAQTS